MKLGVYGWNVAVIANKTSDVAGCYVVNMQLKLLDAFDPVPGDCKAVLVNTEFLTGCKETMYRSPKL